MGGTEMKLEQIQERKLGGLMVLIGIGSVLWNLNQHRILGIMLFMLMTILGMLLLLEKL